GINTGDVVVGNIGSEQRTKYGAVGAAINTAYRIESQTIGGQVLIGPRTHELVRDLVETRGTLAVSLKGVAAPLTIHDVRAIRGTYAAAVPDATATARRVLRAPIAIRCHRLDGKRVAESGFAGTITATS